MFRGPGWNIGVRFPLPLMIMIGSKAGPDLDLFFRYAAPRESKSAKGKKEVGCGNVRIFTYFFLFCYQSASFLDLTRSSFSICFELYDT